MQKVHKRIDYTIDIPDYGAHMDIDQLQRHMKDMGSHFFDADTMRFFRSRCDYHVYAGPDGWYFVTSEKHQSYDGRINEPRLYTVRRMSVVTRDNGTQDLDLFELEGFQPYRTLKTARKRAEYYAKKGAAICPKCRLRLMLACTECVRAGKNGGKDEA